MKIFLTVIILAAIFFGIYYFLSSPEETGILPQNFNSAENLEETNMQIISSVFENGTSIPSLYTCDGKNINPPLEFFGVPEKTVSLALLMHDPDVPKDRRPDGNFDHWLVWNIPPETRVIKEGVATAGVSGYNTAGRTGYTGPCPPDREHRYFFRLYALDTMLQINPRSTRTEIEAAMQNHLLDQAELMGLYNRN